MYLSTSQNIKIQFFKKMYAECWPSRFSSKIFLEPKRRKYLCTLTLHPSQPLLRSICDRNAGQTTKTEETSGEKATQSRNVHTKTKRGRRTPSFRLLPCNRRGLAIIFGSELAIADHRRQLVKKWSVMTDTAIHRFISSDRVCRVSNETLTRPSIIKFGEISSKNTGHRVGN